MKSGVSLFLIIILCLVVTSSSAEDQQSTDYIQAEWLLMITPQENAGVVGKKPEIQAEFSGKIRPDTLLVLLDGTDITQLLDLTEKGFRYKPFLVLPAGMHTISISASDAEGRQLRRDISFTTRHSRTFDEVYTSNDASLIYETILSNPDAFPYIPDSKVEGNLRSDTKIREGPWESTFTTNLRYFDQNLPSSYIQKGFTVANWLFTGSYSKDLMKLKTEIGDVMVNETMYTVSNLARRGGVLAFQYDNVQLSAFSVRSEQVFGMKGGTGIEGTSDDHILGASGGIHFYDRKLRFKGVYATGGEPSGSFGISTTSGKKKGDVIGFLITSDFFQNKLRTEIEAGFSKFDPDTSDEFGSRNDKAYKLKAGGSLGIYNYEAAYEYIGRDYAVVGNQMIQKDKEGVSFVNSINLFPHAVNLNFSRYNDNVRGDDLFPRIVNCQAMLDYSFSKIPNLPIGFSYMKSIQDSTREPNKYYELNMHTDMIAGRVNYMKDRLNVGFQTSYSQQDDRTKGNNDTKTLTFSLIPSYNITNISFSPAFSYNRSEFPQRDLHTDTYTVNLDLRTRFFRERASFDIGSSYNVMKADDGSMNNKTLNSNFRLAYAFRNFLKGYVNPTVALRGTHLKVTDKVYSQSNKDEFLLMFVLTAAMPYSF
jgi:hypothetical protein